MSLTMTKNGALYAVQHGATSDAFEIRARSKSLLNTRGPLHLVSLGGRAGIPIA
jgi:hypothetical protein